MKSGECSVHTWNAHEGLECGGGKCSYLSGKEKCKGHQLHKVNADEELFRNDASEWRSTWRSILKRHNDVSVGREIGWDLKDQRAVDMEEQ